MSRPRRRRTAATARRRRPAAHAEGAGRVGSFWFGLRSALWPQRLVVDGRTEPDRAVAALRRRYDPSAPWGDRVGLIRVDGDTIRLRVTNDHRRLTCGISVEGTFHPGRPVRFEGWIRPTLNNVIIVAAAIIGLALPIDGVIDAWRTPTSRLDPSDIVWVAAACLAFELLCLCSLASARRLVARATKDIHDALH